MDIYFKNGSFIKTIDKPMNKRKEVDNMNMTTAVTTITTVNETPRTITYGDCTGRSNINSIGSYADNKWSKQFFKGYTDDEKLFVTSNKEKTPPVVNKIAQDVDRVTTEIRNKYVNWYKIKEFKIINNKVIEVLFYDDKKVKVVCHEDDVFDLRRGLFLAMAKHQLKETHTMEGIEHEATQFSYLKGYNRIVDDAIKEHNKKAKEEAKQKQIEEEQKRVRENKKRKHTEYLKRREEKRRRKEMKNKTEEYKLLLDMMKNVKV